METSRVALVTGGTSGIGLETVRQFAAKGFEVYACSRSPFDRTALDEKLAVNIHHDVIDVGQPDQLIGWINSIGKSKGQIDVLVNNAAFVVKKSIEEFLPNDFVQSLQVNLLAVLESTKAALPYLESTNCGVIINLSSMAAIDPFPGFSVYGACKAFIEVFTRAIATELLGRQVRCYSIRAGAVETPLLRSVLPEFPKEETLRPGQIAELIVRLAADTSSHKSGEPIELTAETIDGYDLAEGE